MEKKRIAVAVLIVLVLAAGSYWAYREFFDPYGDIIEATGTIEATTYELNARMAGAIDKIYVKTGERVRRGELAVELSRNDLLAQRERDELAVLKAQAYLDDMLSGARVQEKNEAYANADIARVEYERASDELERVRALYEAGAVSEVELENARTVCEISKNRLTASKAKLSLLEEGSRPEQIEAARAEVERSRAVLKATESVLEDLQVYSPIDGAVLSANYEQGEFVQMGASLLTVADTDDLWIRVYIPTDDLPFIKLGQEVSFRVSGHSMAFKGMVEEIATQGEFTPKTIQTKKERTNVVFGVKLRINNTADGILKPGMPADVSFERGIEK